MPAAPRSTAACGQAPENPEDGLGVGISMDGRGRWMDNIFTGRLWRSVKYECVYLHGHGTPAGLRHGPASWLESHSHRRQHQHQHPGNLTPSQVYEATAALSGFIVFQGSIPIRTRGTAGTPLPWRTTL